MGSAAVGASGAEVGAFSGLPAASTALRLFSSSRFCIRSIASFSARGKSAAGSLNLVPAANATPRQMREERLPGCVLNRSQSQLMPDFRRGIGEDGIDQRRYDADGLGCCCQDAGLMALMILVGAVGRLLPRRVGGEVTVSFGDEEPEDL